jgi:transcriptional regulator with XRE-family HTH domain
MSFGKRLQEERKKKGLSQEEVAKHLKTKAPVVGRYEREEMKPSIEVATKIADLLGISLDYLVGKTDTELNNDIVNRVVEIQSLPEEDKSHILYTLDNLLQNVRTRKAFALK